MNFTVYTQNVYEPYATSYFKGHSLLTTGSIINGIVRIVSYPLLAKLVDVREKSISRRIVRFFSSTRLTNETTAFWTPSWFRRGCAVDGVGQCYVRRLPEC